jgi:hypothetical protein
MVQLIPIFESTHTSIIHWELSQLVLAARHGSKLYSTLDFYTKRMGCQIVTKGAMYFGLNGKFHGTSVFVMRFDRALG